MNPRFLAQTPYRLGSLHGVGPLGSSEFLDEPLTRFELVISWLIGVMTIVAGLFFLFLIIIHAYGWMSAGGDKSKLQKAQQGITQAIIGLVVVIAAYTLVSIVGYVLGFSILNPASVLGGIWSTS